MRNLKEFGKRDVLFALDINKRSIGCDFGKPVALSKLILHDSDSTRAGRPGSRLKASDLRVWVSDTNQSDWRQLQAGPQPEPALR